MKVAICGLGYVGAVSAGCLAKIGREVMGVEPDPLKADAVRAGRSPVSEPQLDELLANAVSAGRLTVGSLADAVAQSDVVMVAVGTPSNAAGDLELGAVRRVCQDIGHALPRDGQFRTVVIRSTVLPGTTEEVVRPELERASGRTAGEDFGLATNPEFLREGSGVRDFFEASRTVIGADDQRSAEAVRLAYEGLDVPVHQLSTRASEMVKYTDNAFHALKVAFANEIGSIARAHGLDGREVMQLMTTDTRLNISPAYLRPGFAFGGSCLPKDLRALVARAQAAAVEVPLLRGTLTSNEAHFRRALQLVEAVGERSVALLGLSFKSGTDDLRESPAVALAQELLAKGYSVSIYDEDVRPNSLLGANRRYIEEHIPHIGRLLSDSLDATLAAAGAIVVTKLSPAVDDLPSRLAARHSVVDLCGVPWRRESHAGDYVGLAW